MSKGFIPGFFKLANLLFLLYTGMIWFSFIVPLVAIYAVIFLAYILMYAQGGITIKMDNTTGRVMWAGVFVMVWLAFLGFYNQIGTVIVALLLYFLKPDIKKDLLRYVTKWTAIIVGIGVLEFFALKAVALPVFGILRPPSYPEYENYLFFLNNLDPFLMDMVVYRFNGPFIEPGHLSMVCSFLIIANKFELRRAYYNWILLFAILLSFSLAGYLLLFLAFILIRIRSAKTMIGLALFAVLVVFGFGQFGSSSQGDAIQVLIMERLKSDDRRGIQGNNRNWGQTERYFAKQWDDGNLWAGLGSADYTRLLASRYIGGAGIRIYILGYGIIGMCLFFLLYLFVAMGNKDKRFAYAFLLMMVLSFLQRGYIGTYAWLFPFITALPPTRRTVGVLNPYKWFASGRKDN